MQTESATHQTHKNKSEGGIIYRTTCQNPGCGHTFDLRVTPANASLLSGTMACPRCRRHGGMLKPQGRLGQQAVFSEVSFPADRRRPATRRRRTPRCERISLKAKNQLSTRYRISLSVAPPKPQDKTRRRASYTVGALSI